MSKQLEVGCLMLEVTRRCNMACPHCLRGEAQMVDMQKRTVDKLLDMVDSISSVVFTGGEPTLNLPVIEYAFEQFRQRLGYMPAFWMATNGKEHQLELIPVLIKAYSECRDQEVCGVAVSVDDFHEVIPETENYLKTLKFYDPSKEHRRGDSRWVINRGRAITSGLDGRQPMAINNELSISRFGQTAYIETLAVTAKEEIFSDCDYAYDDTLDMVCMLADLPEYVAASVAS